VFPVKRAQRSDSHHAALGWLVSSAANLDLLTFNFMVARAGITMATANLLMGRDNFDATLARLGRLVEASDLTPPVKKEFREWNKRATEAMQLRNQLVHSAWINPGRAPDGLDQLVRHREPLDGIKANPTNVREIESLAERLDELTNQLLQMADLLGVLA